VIDLFSLCVNIRFSPLASPYTYVYPCKVHFSCKKFTKVFWLTILLLLLKEKWSYICKSYLWKETVQDDLKVVNLDLFFVTPYICMFLCILGPGTTSAVSKWFWFNFFLLNGDIIRIAFIHTYIRFLLFPIFCWSICTVHKMHKCESLWFSISSPF